MRSQIFCQTVQILRRQPDGLHVKIVRNDGNGCRQVIRRELRGVALILSVYIDIDIFSHSLQIEFKLLLIVGIKSVHHN